MRNSAKYLSRDQEQIEIPFRVLIIVKHFGLGSILAKTNQAEASREIISVVMFKFRRIYR